MIEEGKRIKQMCEPILALYREHKKQMPWRDSPTPYHVWISEIMLQQTRIEAVIPYYERFLRELPDVAALAAVPEDKLMKLWEGLGYYSRARNLGRAAKIMMEKYGGALPETAEALRALPGIGEYTAGAIASIAFGKPEPAVDGNVLRVVMRYLGRGDDIALPATKRQVTAALSQIYPAGEDAKNLTQGIMELGETVCIPNGEAKCGICPLFSQCVAGREQLTDKLPYKSPKKARKTELRTVLLFSCRGKYAIRRRADAGLLAGLWEFPNLDGHLHAEEVMAYARGMGIEPIAAAPCGDAVHIFTHVEWHMTGYAVECACMSPAFIWETPAEIRSSYAIPTAFRAFAEKMETDAF